MKVYKTTWIDGKTRSCTDRKCVWCEKTFPFPVYRLKEKAGKYCSKKCSDAGSQNRVTIECALCKKKVQKTPSKILSIDRMFCSRICKEKAQTIDVGLLKIASYKDGKTSYRKRAFTRYGAKCKHCGYSKKQKMLDVDHIDSDRNNNAIKNLQVLCVWCHAWKTRNI